MTTWAEFEQDAPQLAAVVHRLMSGHKHKVLATLRKDGSPRVSGTETAFRDGELWMGSMPGAVKALDLRRDPRMAIHVTSPDPDESDPSSWPGDAKVSGRAEEVTDPAVLAAHELPGSGAHLFRVSVEEVVWTRVSGDELVIDSWHAGRGFRRIARK
ncbi:pyridoxamine 5'-phosphate oxidase family protein [Nonomuraea sp. NPDC050328]|uniref:pyridoxamine 5'-phosphate oxidase family protein n=1 Tax=Nonomuraea sp. NPDC050328 TaxID=3364361 RepID=UPI0037B67867